MTDSLELAHTVIAPLKRPLIQINGSNGLTDLRTKGIEKLERWNTSTYQRRDGRDGESQAFEFSSRHVQNESVSGLRQTP